MCIDLLCTLPLILSFFTPFSFFGMVHFAKALRVVAAGYHFCSLAVIMNNIIRSFMFIQEKTMLKFFPILYIQPYKQTTIFRVKLTYNIQLVA